MLKVKFWKIENVVLMKVLEQGNEICRGAGVFYKDKETGLTLASNLYVAISRDVLYVRGEKRQDDNSIVTRNLNTITESNDFYNRAIKTIQNYNRSLSEQSNSEDVKIDCFIAE